MGVVLEPMTRAVLRSPRGEFMPMVGGLGLCGGNENTPNRDEREKFCGISLEVQRAVTLTFVTLTLLPRPLQLFLLIKLLA